MKAPAWWYGAGREDAVGRLLAPFGWLYRQGTALRVRARPRYRARAPVVCVGNLVAGGAGKTPVVLALVEELRRLGRRPVVLSRGYGGQVGAPTRVDPLTHGSAKVGDEPLLLATVAETWVARDRAQGARAIELRGHDPKRVILLDDGFQDPSLHKTLSLLVFDGAVGIGNGRGIPAGPLREGLAGAVRARAAVIVGPDPTNLARRLAPLPILRAQLETVDVARFAGRKLVAFAGIGRPERVREALQAAGAELVVWRAFPDHHRYSQDDILDLANLAGKYGAMMVTTEKDRVRLPNRWPGRVHGLAVRLRFEEPQALARLLARLP